MLYMIPSYTYSESHMLKVQKHVLCRVYMIRSVSEPSNILIIESHRILTRNIKTVGKTAFTEFILVDMY